MELREVTSFHLLEKYLKERNQFINCYEMNVLQWLLQFLEERQLFFLVKDIGFCNVPKFMPNRHLLYFLMNQYKEKIRGKYDIHQMKGLTIRWEGNFWVKDSNSNQFFPFYPVPETEEVFADHFSLPTLKRERDYITLYEDEIVHIIAFLLKRQRFYCRNVKNNEFVIEENGFYVKEDDPFHIFPYDSPYSYFFRVWSYSEMAKSFSLKELQVIQNYYENQQEALKQILKEQEKVRKKQF